MFQCFAAAEGMWVVWTFAICPLVIPSKARSLKSVNGLGAAVLDSSLCSE